jgi:hypothetical protein
MALQEWFHREGLLADIVPRLSDAQAQVRNKALLALSAMLRGHTASLEDFWTRWQGLDKLDALVRGIVTIGCTQLLLVRR